MNLESSDEHTPLFHLYTRFFKEQSTSDRIRMAEPLGFDAGLWRQLVEMEVFSSRACHRHGGIGMSLHDLSLIAYQSGYYLAPVPLIECVVAAKLLSAIGKGRALSWFDRIMSGTAIVSLALSPIDSNGRQLIPSGAVADAVIAFDGRELVLITDSPRRNSCVGIRNMLPAAEWNLACSPCIFLANGGVARNLYEDALHEWKILVAAQMNGIAARALEYADYTNESDLGAPTSTPSQRSPTPLADEYYRADDRSKLLVDLAIWK